MGLKEHVVVLDRLSHQTIAHFEHHIAHGQLLIVHLVILLTVILIAVIETVLRIVLKHGTGIPIAAVIAAGSAGIYLYGVGLIRILRAMSVIGKQERAPETGSILFVIAMALHSLVVSVNKHVTCIFYLVSGSVNSVKGLWGRIVNAGYSLADIVYLIALQQFLHKRNGQTPVTINGVQTHGFKYIIVTAAAHGAYMIQIVIIFKECHQTGHTSLHRRLVNNAGLGNTILGHNRFIVGNHNCHAAAADNSLVFPLACQVALHLAIYHCPVHNRCCGSHILFA